MKIIAKWIYKKVLPIYIPKRIVRYKLAIWCCIDVKDSGNLWKVLKGIRITIRKLGSAIFVIKKGEV